MMKRALLVLGVLSSACRAPYDPVPAGSDLSAAFPTVTWSRFASTPGNVGRASLPLVTTASALVGFGGLPHGDTSTWTLPLSGTTWSALPVSMPPVGRDGHCAALLPSGDVLFTGGVTDSGTAPSVLLDRGASAYTTIANDRPTAGSGCGASYLVRDGGAIVYGGDATPDDTWKFDGTTWTKLTPPSTPGGRVGAGLVTDPGETTDAGTTDFLVLYSGLSGGTEADDVWVFDGTTWIELSTISDPNAQDDYQPRPDGRTNAAVAMDPARRILYVFGGARQGQYLNDLWALDLPTTQWRQLSATSDAGSAPSGRASSSAAYDSLNDRFLVFGGRDENGLLADGWALTVSK